MQHLIAALGLAAVALAAPQPEVARAIKARQVGGGLGGFVPGASGFLSGTVPASGAPFGCIGGDGIEICAREPAKTPSPEVARAVAARQIGGGLGGYIPGASGFLSGTIPASGLPYGCIGGALSGEGFTICARATPAPEVARAVAARQIGGGLGGEVPGASGTATGDIINGIPTGFIGGSAGGLIGGLAGRAPEPTPAPVLERQVGGGLGGFIPGNSGFLSGTVPASGDPFGCIGGDGVTVCARDPEPTPAPVLERQVGGGLGGFIPGNSGFLSGTVPASGVPFGCIGGDGVTVCAREAAPAPTGGPLMLERQVGGGLGGEVPGASGTATGDIINGIPTGFIGGEAGGLIGSL